MGRVPAMRMRRILTIREIYSTMTLSGVVFPVLLAALGLVLHGCAVLTSPVASAVIGGAQLAIKGAELQKEIRKADAQLAVDTPFEKAWEASLTALVNLGIEGIRSERTTQGDGGLFEGTAGKTKIRVVVAKLTEEITEFGIRASHDKALAGLIAERIKEEALEDIAFRRTHSRYRPAQSLLYSAERSR